MTLDQLMKSKNEKEAAIKRLSATVKAAELHPDEPVWMQIAEDGVYLRGSAREYVLDKLRDMIVEHETDLAEYECKIAAINELLRGVP